MGFKRISLMLIALAVCGILAVSGCNKKDDKTGGDAKGAEKQAPKGPDFGTMPKDLCDLEGIKKITMDVIDNQVFITTDQENLWGGQTIESLVEMAKSMAEGFLDMVPEPKNCEVKQEIAVCGDALGALNKANGSAYDLDVMKKNMDTLKVKECGRLTQEMDAWGSRFTTYYYVGKIGGEWKYLFTVSQNQLDMQETKDKEKEEEPAE
jgi:hypothetical protein